MNPRIESVKPKDNYKLLLKFTNGEERIFDVKPYLESGIFRDLKNPEEFNTVKPLLGSITWRGGQDFCPDTLYLESEPVN